MDTGSPDTSLATPSDKDLSSGQRRVLHQVNTMKRSKSKYKNGAATSPTSPAPQISKTSDFGFKYRATSTYSRTNSSGSAGLQNRKSRSLTSKSMKGRLVSSNTEQVNTSSWTKSPNGLKPSRSDPALTSASHLAPAFSMKAKRQNSSSQIQVTKESRSINNGPTFTQSQTRISQQPYTQSQTDGKLGTIRVSEIKQSSTVNSTGNMQDIINLEQAVKYLSSTDENYQKLGACFIQHVCFKDDLAKIKVFDLQGIPPLVKMLDSAKSDLQMVASGALRNLVYKNVPNKRAVQECGGIAKILNQMNTKNTKSPETRKQLAGLLWNLSSAEELRLELISTALIALTKNVVVPFSISQDNLHGNPEVFYFATGCLRNLSSGSEEDREKMRLCPNLIEALVTYISSCLKEETPDEKPVENCVCTLHNLTYQLWHECPEASLSVEMTRRKTEGRKSPTVGCFSPRSRKMKEEIFSTSSGVKWLYNSQAIDAYVSLLKFAKIDATKEACCGIMQNLTAGNENQAEAMSKLLLKKLEDNSLLFCLLWSKVTGKPYACFLDNMSRKPSLHSLMAKKILPVFGKVLIEFGKLLTEENWDDQVDADTVAIICKVLPRLMVVNQKITKKVIKRDVISGLKTFCEKHPEDSGTQAASELLHNLWTDEFLRRTIKHLKLSKSIFIISRKSGADQEANNSRVELPPKD